MNNKTHCQNLHSTLCRTPQSPGGIKWWALNTHYPQHSSSLSHAAAGFHTGGSGDSYIDMNKLHRMWKEIITMLTSVQLQRLYFR